jgi:hypothetical protein
MIASSSFFHYMIHYIIVRTLYDELFRPANDPVKLIVFGIAIALAIWFAVRRFSR